MYRIVKNYLNKRNLKDEKYLYLFDNPIDDEYICFDCETTGLNPQIDDIISIGAVLIKNNTIVSSKKFVKFVKPKTKLQAEAIKVHHIRECDLANAEEIDDVIVDEIPLQEEKTLSDEVSVVEQLSESSPKQNQNINKNNNQNLEVSAIYHDFKIEAIPQSHIDLRFDAILRELQIPSLGKHDAYNDAIMTAMIFLKLKNQATVKIP